MRRLTILASALAIVWASSAIAQAGCKQAHVNNRSWKLTLQDEGGALIYCKFQTSRTGTITGNPTGCEYSSVGGDADFNSPRSLAIFEGSITMVPDDQCTYDLTLRIDNAGTSVLKARMVLEAGKTIANGNYLHSSNEGAGRPISGGTISMMRQAKR